MPRGTILIADDDAAIRTVLNQALARAGYSPRATGNAATLWRWVSQGEGDVVITDVIMPGSNGRTLARDIAALQPGLKSLFISGYPADFIAERGVLDEGVHFLPKPFTLHQLAVSVRVAIDVALPPAKIRENKEDAA